MIEIKNKIMKSRRHYNFPLWVYFLPAVVMIFFSCTVTLPDVLPERIIGNIALLSTPDVAHMKLEELKHRFLLKYGADSYNQKSGSMNDLFSLRDFSDLTKTPEDILQTSRKLQSDFIEGGYEYDGDVVDVTYLNQQVTDSSGIVRLRNVTENTEINIEKLLSEEFSLPCDDPSQPLVLIYHTHTTESYIPADIGRFSSSYPTRSDDKNANMIRVGEEICAVLEAKGISVVHDKNVYDEKYTGAYEKSRAGIEKILSRYPSIIITLDIHRDAIYYDDTTRISPVTEINGKKAAQMMIIAGAEGGNVTSFPTWQTNLSFALNLFKSVNTDYDNLMKPIYFCNRLYNMDVTPYSLLIEVGTDVNTLEQACLSARLLGSSLAKLIKESIK